MSFGNYVCEQVAIKQIVGSVTLFNKLDGTLSKFHIEFDPIRCADSSGR